MPPGIAPSAGEPAPRGETAVRSVVAVALANLERQALWTACQTARASALAADSHAARALALVDDAQRLLRTLREAAEAARTAAREAHAACEALGTHPAMPPHF